MAAVILLHIFANKRRIFFYNVMVAEKRIISFFLIKLMEQAINIGIYAGDFGKSLIFPQFVAISEIEIGESMVVIILYSGIVNILIMPEIVYPASVTSMAVTK